MKKLLVVVLALVAFSGCTRIETGHVGVLVNWNKTIEPGELQPGTHSAIIADILDVVANEVTLSLNDLHPQTKDKTLLKDLDLNVIYQIDPTKISDLYARYKNRHLISNHQVYPMFNYIDTVAASSASKAVSHYEALEANGNKELIEAEIKVAMEEKFKEEGLEGSIKIKSVIVKQLVIPDSLKASSENVINEQNKLKAKDFEVQTAEREAARMKALSVQVTPGYIEFMKAQAGLIHAQAEADAIRSGKVPNWIMPSNFQGMISMK